MPHDETSKMTRAWTLAHAISYPTISNSDGETDYEALDAFNAYIDEKFAELHSKSFINLEMVNNYSRFYKVT